MSWVATATLALTAYQGHQSAKANNAVSEQNHKAALIAQTYENRSINEGLREEQDIAADKKLEMQKQALKATSTLQAQGRSVAGGDGISQEIMNNLGSAVSQLEATVAGKRRQASMEKRGATARAQSRINSMPKVSYNPVADVAQAGLAIYGDFKTESRAVHQASGGAKDLSALDYFWGDY